MTDRGLNEECGVFGIWGVDDAPDLVYYGLHALQHRGQEGCGIVAVDAAGKMTRIKGEGLVTEVFDEDKLSALHRKMAIGHVRYSTTGGGGLENVQPFLFRHHTGDFALAHNGNLVNYDLLRRNLEDLGSLFQSSSDSEVLAHLIKKDSASAHKPRIYAIENALNAVEGAFAFLIMTSKRIYACRDKNGLRPLSIGRLGDGYVVSSETCAFDVLGAEFIRDVEPGEIVTIDHHGIRARKYTHSCSHDMCAMEYIYFARPDSILDGVSVHMARQCAGSILAKCAPVAADVVIGVPDSGLDAALGYAQTSGIPYAIGLIKNKYIGRTFIAPEQQERSDGVKIKLSPIASVLKGKRVVLVDDSIVRGTTAHQLVKLIRDAGASEVHMRITAPPFLHPCYYGTDIDSEENLIANQHTVEDIAEMIGVNTLAYLPIASLKELVEGSDYCAACFTGDYPTERPNDMDKNRFQRKLSERTE